MRRAVGPFIKKKAIQVYTDKDFVAVYKGKRIMITNTHDFGVSEYKHLKRYCISVTDIKTGVVDLRLIEDCFNIRYAIGIGVFNMLYSLGENILSYNRNLIEE